MVSGHHHARRETLSGPFPVVRFSDSADSTDLAWPFGRLEGLSPDDVRETAYEIFFTACRSSPGFGGGRNALSFYPADEAASSPRSSSHFVGGGGGVVVTTPTSRVKRALGLKMVKRSPSRRMTGGGGSSPASSALSGISMATVPHGARPRRPLTSAEIMRQQMRVSEQSDNRLRKTLMRTLVGQMGRRAETIILPLELLRHLKPSEFNDSREYHTWQKRQLKVLELGLLLHPSLPLDPSAAPFATRLRAAIRVAESSSRPLDLSSAASKNNNNSNNSNSDTMRTLCNSAVSLSWRGGSSGNADVCRWADGGPLNAHLYISLLTAVFDPRDETLVLDEVDELLELIRKTWQTLGVTRSFHNACFAWVLFRQYVSTAMVEPDLLSAAHTVLAAEVSAGGGGGEVFSAVVGSVREWAEKRLMRYHEYFLRGTVGQIEALLPVALLEADAESMGEDSSDQVNYYIRSSLTNAFQKLVESGKTGGGGGGEEDKEKDKEKEKEKEKGKPRSSTMLIKLAKETEVLASREKKCFSPILKRWHSGAAAVAAATLHSCFGAALRKYLASVKTLTAEAVEVLQAAGKLEKILVHMVVEDSADCSDGGKSIVREMVPYEVESFISDLVNAWIEQRIEKGRECIRRAKESESWNPRSKSEPYAQSGMELVKIAQETVEELFEIPIGITESLAHDVASGLDTLFQDYSAFVMSCAPKQSYIPALPPLTRCSKDSKILKLWKKATPCGANPDEPYLSGPAVDPRQSTSRGTQRLYIRLNTLYHLLSRLSSLDKALTLGGAVGPYLDPSRASARAAAHRVAESAAYRLIFLDSGPVLYEGLYAEGVADATRIRPALRALKQNLTLMSAVLDDPGARSAVAREVLRAALEAFLMVLLAGGPSRAFDRADHPAIQEDFEALKKLFDGLVPEPALERDAGPAAGVIDLMGRPTEELVEEFSVSTCEASGAAGVAGGAAATQGLLPMPPTTGRWCCSDANTVLRVLCHRDDKVANQFLKKTFQLPKRR